MLLSLCVCAEIGSSKFFRLDDSKVLAWLYHKVRLHLLKLNFGPWGYAKQEEPTFCLFFISIWLRDLINTNLTSKCLRLINLTFLSALHTIWSYLHQSPTCCMMMHWVLNNTFHKYMRIQSGTLKGSLDTHNLAFVINLGSFFFFF